jgi:hypothetical protein
MESKVSIDKRVCYACGSDETQFITSCGVTYPSWIKADGHTYCRRCYQRLVYEPRYRGKRLETYRTSGRFKIRNYYIKNRKTILQQKHEYWIKNKITLSSQKDIYRMKNFQKISVQRKEHYKTNRELILRKGKPGALALRRKQRLAVLQHYSNNRLVCACCQESIYEFLTIDHINNDGNIQIKIYGKSGLYRWLIKQNFPEGYQVLCYNCNCAKGRYGYCPHQQKVLLPKSIITE